MDNQHRLIEGYRELTQDEIDTINQIKGEGGVLGAMIRDLQAVEDYDQRWVSIAKTHFQQGIMAAVRAVAQPDGF